MSDKSTFLRENIESAENTANKTEDEAQQKQKYKATVVMNGDTQTIESHNQTETIIIENENEHENESQKSNDAIVIAECTNKRISNESSDDCTNCPQHKNDKIKPFINNAINETSHLCLNGIKDNEDSNIRVIGNNVIRTNKIESLIQKMDQHNALNTLNTRNPVTNRFSTYYQRSDGIGGTLLKSEEIAHKYIEYDDIMTIEHETESDDIDDMDAMDTVVSDVAVDIDDDDDAAVDEDDDDDVDVHDTDHNNGTIEVDVRTRARTRMEHQNYKKAKKYCTPSDELTRLEIREDIRKMRNPKMQEMKVILCAIGFEQFLNHKAYVSDYRNSHSHSHNHNHSHSHSNANDDEVQFIGINTTKYKKRKKKKRKHRSYDYEHYNYSFAHYHENSVFSVSSDNYKEDEPQPQQQPQPQPHQKRQKVNDDNDDVDVDMQESIKCNQCNKIFTLEVDLLLHKTNDKC